MEQLGNKYKKELLTLLKLLKGQKILGFFYEEKDNNWSLFIHLPSGVIQIGGNNKRRLKETIYFSPIIETIPQPR